MAKGKKIKTDDVIEAPIAEVKPEDLNLVAIEMSPDERDEFVEFMRKKKQEKAEKAVPQRMMTVRLLWAHHINGKKYGPGRAQIPEDQWGQIAKAEYEQKKQELNLHTSSKRLTQIMESGEQRAMPVDNNSPVKFL